MNTVFLMEPFSGVVQTVEEWRADYAILSSDVWGGNNFEDANLVPVVWDEVTDYWQEV